MRDVQEQLREFSRSLVDSLPALDPKSVTDPVVGSAKRPAHGGQWRPWVAVAGLAMAAVVAVPMFLFGGDPPVDTSPLPTVPAEIEPIDRSVELVPFVDGSPWTQVLYIPYGPTAEMLGFGEAWGPELPVSRDSFGNWWISDIYKRRIAVFSPDLQLVRAVPVEVSHALHGPWILDDGTAIALTGRKEVAVVIDGAVEVWEMPELSIGEAVPRLLGTDGKRVFGEILDSSVRMRFAIDIVSGAPVVSPVDYLTTPMGNRYVLNYRSGRVDLVLPDAAAPVELRIEGSTGGGESLEFSSYAIGASDGTIHLLLSGTASSNEGEGLGVYVHIGSDGTVMRTATIPDPYGVRDPGGPRLSLDPVTGNPFISVMEGRGVRIWRLDVVPSEAIPSQSAADALRDGVDPVIAAIPLEHRVSARVEIEASEGTWVLSRISETYLDSRRTSGCSLGDPEPFCLWEYGEILLLDSDGMILRAFPMPGFHPSWITVTDGHVYAGSIGDGGLPDSSLARIERSTLESTIAGLPTGMHFFPDMWPSGWYVGSQEHADRFWEVVGFAPQGMTGTPVQSWIGEVVVDLPGVDQLINDVVAYAGLPSQTEADALRDGVVPSLAAVGYDLRVHELSRIEMEEGAWILSEISRELRERSIADGCGFGDLSGLEPEEVICTYEYGEILLVRDRQIVRAFPIPSTPPSWIEITEDYVYVGRVGDGALPHSALVRIDRVTFEAVFVVVDADGEPIPSWMWGSHWLVADESYRDRLASVVGTGPGAPGQPVTSWVGDVRVDIDGVDRIIKEVLESGGQVAG